MVSYSNLESRGWLPPQDAEKLRDEIVRLRELIGRSATMLDDAYSGYISGSREDENWHKFKESLITDLRAAEQSAREEGK